jgi:hypothetical protein
MNSIPLQFDEYCDLAAGMEWQAFLESLLIAGPKERLQLIEQQEKEQPLIGSSSIYKNDPQGRFGLEVFLLKLSVVSELCHAMHAWHQILHGPLQNLNPRTVRVEIFRNHMLVPWLWNFSFEILESAHSVSNDESRDARFISPTATREAAAIADDFFSLGMMLFRALLVNHEQDMDVINRRCSEVAAQLHQAGTRSEQAQSGQRLIDLLNNIFQDRTFQPGNVFYNPDGPAAAVIKPALWNEALLLGFRLITRIPAFSYFPAKATGIPGVELTEREAPDRVIGDLNALLAKTKQALFFEPPKMDQNIQTVLDELIADPQWINKLITAYAPATATQPAMQQPPIEEPVIASQGAGLDETIIVSRTGKAGPAAPSAPAPHRTAQMQQPPKPAEPAAQAQQPPLQPAPAGELDETIIVRPGASAAPQPQHPSPPSFVKKPQSKPSTEAQQPEEGNLDETIIVPKKKP